MAHAFADATSRPACFVDLTRVREADLVSELIARELGIHVGSSTSADAR